MTSPTPAAKLSVAKRLEELRHWEFGLRLEREQVDALIKWADHVEKCSCCNTPLFQEFARTLGAADGLKQRKQVCVD